MNQGDALERLIELQGSQIYVSIVRSAANDGGAIVRRGILRLKRTREQILSAGPAEDFIAEVVDDDDIRLVSILSTEVVRRFNDVLRFERRLAFYVDLSLAKPPGFEDPAGAISYLEFCRNIAAELEAGLRAGVMMSPDPDPEASWKAPYSQIIPLDAGFKGEQRWNVSANMCSATIAEAPREGFARAWFFAPDAKTCTLTMGIFEGTNGSKYPLTSDGASLLGRDLRAMFYGRVDHLVRISS